MNPLLCQLSYAASTVAEDTNPTCGDKAGSRSGGAGGGGAGKKTAGGSAQNHPPRGECVCCWGSRRGRRWRGGRAAAPGFYGKRPQRPPGIRSSTSEPGFVSRRLAGRERLPTPRPCVPSDQSNRRAASQKTTISHANADERRAAAGAGVQELSNGGRLAYALGTSWTPASGTSSRSLLNPARRGGSPASAGPRWRGA